MNLVVETTLPGVTALVNTSQVARPIERQPSSTAFAVGYAPWGPVNTPTVVTSWLEYVRLFGNFHVNSYLDKFAYVFFNLFRGKQLVVCRVVGSSAAAATGQLLSVGQGSGGAAGQTSLYLTARYPSSSVDVRVTVEAGTNNGTYKLTFRSVALNNYKEVFDNFRHPNAEDVELVNSRSRLVTLVVAWGAGQTIRLMPEQIIGAAMINGTAGSDDFAGMTAATFVGTDNGSARTGLQVFKDESLGTGQVLIPGITNSATHAALIAHAEAYHRTAFIDPPLGSDKATVVAIRALYGTWHGAVHWPWVKLSDLAGSGIPLYYPPSIFAASACAEVDSTIGTHKAPANVVIPSALDVERAPNGTTQVDDGAREYLNGKDVNVIAPFTNEGVKIYGARVMTSDRRVQMIHEIRLLNLFYYSAKLAYAWAVFQVVDGGGRLFRDLRSTGAAFLRGFYRDGALFGKREQDAFVVKADADNNPPEELAVGRVHVGWGVKLSPTAEQIIVNIDNVPLFQDLGVLQQ
jgi:phage tail sheath protein FI